VHREVEPAGDEQHGVADGLGFEAAAGITREVEIVGVAVGLMVEG
jgi:hypothetical protein